mgnify:CR=1 FL=1
MTRLVLALAMVSLLPLAACGEAPPPAPAEIAQSPDLWLLIEKRGADEYVIDHSLTGEDCAWQTKTNAEQGRAVFCEQAGPHGRGV